MAHAALCRSIVASPLLAFVLFGACSKTPPSDPPTSCDNVGCAAPPMCAVGCQETCGCCSCAPGERNGELICTTAGCYAPVPVMDGGAAPPDAGADGGWVPPAACALPFDVGPCDAAIRVYAFVNGACVQQTYGGCQGNDNRFRTLEECLSVCAGRPIPNGCPSGRIAQEVCLACGAGGGCSTRGVVCALPCDGSASCADSSFCVQGVCQVGGCI